MGRTDHRSPVAHSGSDGKYLQVGRSEKCGEVGQIDCIPGFQRPNAALHPYKRAGGRLIARNLKGGETCDGPQPPDCRLFHIINDDVRIKKYDHWPSSCCELACSLARTHFSCNRSRACLSSSASSRRELSI